MAGGGAGDEALHEKAAMAIAEAGPSFGARILRYALTLAIVCGISGASIGWVYTIANPRIEELKQRKIRDSLKLAFPARDAVFDGNTLLVDGERVWLARDSAGNVIGACATGRGRGYASEIEILAGMGKDGTIAGVCVLASNETPGLGEKIREVEAKDTLIGMLMGRKSAASGEPAVPWFLRQYFGKRGADLRVEKGKGPGAHHIDAISGATITSKAVTEAVRRAMAAAEKAISAGSQPGAGGR
jgi:electron transport complex protein RnfG